MGTWGTALYSDDLAADIRGDVTVLLQLEERLRTDPPPPKRVPKPFLADNQWAVGEMLVFRLASGKLALFRVVGHHSDTGGRYAVCEILDWIGEELPSESDARGLPVMAPLSPSECSQFRCGEPRRKAEMDRFARTGWTSRASRLAQYSVIVFPYFDRQLREQFGLE